MIFLANLLVLRLGTKLSDHEPIAFCFLFAAILLSYFLPTDTLLNLSWGSTPAMYALLSFVTVLPMGVAAIIFSSSFSKVSNVSRALAFNLFGSVVGGLLEYMSSYWGIRSLDLVALALYFCAMLAYFAHSRRSHGETQTE
jgi:uncharacterized membrane protein